MGANGTNRPGGLSHDQAMGLLSSHMRAQIDRASVAALKVHMGGCSECQQRLGALDLEVPAAAEL